jgi:ribonucleoside-triphosphate reductase
MSTTKRAVSDPIKKIEQKVLKVEPKTNEFVKTIQKRDGSLLTFDLNKITNAVHKAMLAASEGSYVESELVANKVLSDLVRISKKYKNFVPTVEGVQDTVEKELILSEYVSTAKAYILYREKRAHLREQGVAVPEHVKKLVIESKKYFKNPLSEFIFFRSYSRWIENESRRETWVESVARYIDFMRENLGGKLKEEEYNEIHQAILKQDVMPSMRLLWAAGKAARESNATAYNCSFIAPTKPQDLGEIMYLSMSGCGVGYSVETQAAQEFPIVKRQTGKMRKTHEVLDSKTGWADAFVVGLHAWFEGEDIEFDYSKIRPQGARLKTMGGYASGPGPLIELNQYARAKLLGKQAKRLTNLDVHDIICKIGEIVVAGGVRRTALISLSDLDDEQMRHAKDGQFYVVEPQRSMSNNSAIYNEKPSTTQFLDEWLSLVKSQSGERGIFNRGSLMEQMPERRVKQWKQSGYIEDERITGTPGTNPCGEIVLKSKQFCNLTEVVCRARDTEKDLLRKVRLAAMLGTYQSTLTNFKYLSSEWKKNCEDERLLGVSLTGQWDCPVVRDEKVLKNLREESVTVNKEYAKRFKINVSTSITCVKPSGTVSQLVDSSSGMHPRHAKYYIRRVRISATDPLFKMLRDQGVPHHPEVGQNLETANTFVLEFPVKAPAGSTFKDDISALEQLEHWKMVKESYTEHNPSVTVSVSDDEWLKTGNWIYENWDMVGGLSFLPRSNHVYKLAPYEEIDEKKYIEAVKRFGDIDFSKIVTYEKTDETEGAKELACVGGVCEI